MGGSHHSGKEAISGKSPAAQTGGICFEQGIGETGKEEGVNPSAGKSVGKQLNGL